MSEAQAPDAPSCPVPLSALPANFQKHVDPKAPAPLRMMGAKALVPMGPKEMATALGVSDKTVEHHRQNVMNKLGLHDVAALTRYAIRHRMVLP